MQAMKHEAGGQESEGQLELPCDLRYLRASALVGKNCAHCTFLSYTLCSRTTVEPTPTPQMSLIRWTSLLRMALRTYPIHQPPDPLFFRVASYTSRAGLNAAVKLVKDQAGGSNPTGKALAPESIGYGID